jgi:predicted nucleotidyltransferase
MAEVDTMKCVTLLQEQIAAVSRRFGVASLYVFGSRAAEIAAAFRSDGVVGGLSNSDVDIAVQPTSERKLGARDRVRLAATLEDILGVARVDLVVLPEAPAFLAADAIRGERLYCDDEDRQAREELYYLRRAGDLAPFYRERMRALLAGELRR